MKATTRKIDCLGRIVLPYDMRNVLHIMSGDELSFVCDGKAICITKPKDNQSCDCCNGRIKNLISIKNIKLCESCIAEIRNGLGK